MKEFAPMDKDFLRITSPLATHRLVLLHGWGADVEDLIPLGRELIQSNGESQSIELVSLRGPQAHPDGFGRQWYGLFPAAWDEVPSAIDQLTERLKSLSTRSIPLEQTIVLGFSQGGAMALGAGCQLPLAGLISCSAYPHPDWIPPKEIPPTLLVHGKHDEIVPYAASEKILKSLSKHKNKTEFVLFKGGHEIPVGVIPKISLFIQKAL